MARITRATEREIGELEAHAVTLNRALEYLARAAMNARNGHDLPLMTWIDNETLRLTRELRRVQAERRRIRQEVSEQ